MDGPPWEIGPQVRVLFASGYSAEHLTAADQRQARGFVNKPYRPEELARVVRAALDSGQWTVGSGQH